MFEAEEEKFAKSLDAANECAREGVFDFWGIVHEVGLAEGNADYAATGNLLLKTTSDGFYFGKFRHGVYKE